MTDFKQPRVKVGGTGSFLNQLMSNNSSIPEVGKGATEMNYTDRICYEVVEVSPDGKTVNLESLEASWDKALPGGEGHQNWILKPTGNFRTVVWRHNAWRVRVDAIVFTKAFKSKIPADSYAWYELTPEQRAEIYDENFQISKVVEGITERKAQYYPIKILFGVKQYYYDWSF